MEDLFDVSTLSPTDPIFLLARNITPQTSPQPVQKKKPKFIHQRDSLRSRLKIGNPGSRRYRKWKGEQDLRDYLSESESSISDDGQDFDEACEPTFGAFASYFYDPAVRAALNPFLNTTEEEQRTAVGSPSDSEDSEANCSGTESMMSLSPSDTFQLLNSRSQRMLKKHYSENCGSVSALDQQIFDFCSNEYSQQFSLKPDCAFGRLLVHSIAEFYSLICYSKTTEEGRSVLLKKRPDFLIPTSSLSDYLTTIA